ncbi:hypothetical protein [Sandaracinobacteroides hominis]|uniref:hypothetical protein n=1 Tax=Sandaracinobacteroides hominis TaxID=2780086 RepID=UPI0018F74C5F|nr:hypothetical protein [Sandaracinobacteroides hominis]
MEELLAGEHEKLSRKAIDLALAGDTVALRLCLDRIAPARRDAPISIALPSVRDAAGLVEAGAVVAAALAAGEITPEEAARCMAVLHAQRQIIETGQFAERLAALEAGHVELQPHWPVSAQPAIEPSHDSPATIVDEVGPATAWRAPSPAEADVMGRISLLPHDAAIGGPWGQVRQDLAPTATLLALEKECRMLEVLSHRDGHIRVRWTDLGANWRRQANG